MLTNKIINPLTGRLIIVNGPTYKELIKNGYDLSSEKKIRRRIFFDTYPPHIAPYRQFDPPSPPLNWRRRLWMAPNCEYLTLIGMSYESKKNAHL